MIFKLKPINEKVTVTAEYTYPLYRRTTVNENHFVYYKAESPHKLTIIEKTGESSVALEVHDDANVDWISEYFDERLLNGTYQHDIISEDVFNRSALQHIINLVYKS